MWSLACVVLALAPWLLCGCDRTCGSRPPGLERDRCAFDEIQALGPERSSEVLARALLIQDPIVRAAAVHSWVVAHRGQLPREDALELCETALPPEEAGNCRRTIDAAHLR